MNFLDFIFRKYEEPVEPADGYLTHSPVTHSIMRPGVYECFGREVKILGFDQAGQLFATLYMCHKGTGECSEWRTLGFHRMSSGDGDETWDCLIDKCAIVLHATEQGGRLKVKIEVDK